MMARMSIDGPVVRGDRAAGDDASMWARAFPDAAEADVRAAVAALGPSHLSPSGSFTVVAAGRPVEIPYRIYSSPSDADSIARLTGGQRQLLDAMVTRHHDGFVRQDSVARLLRIADDWTIPFVVHVIGDGLAPPVQDILDAPDVGTLFAQSIGNRGGRVGFAAQERQLLEVVRQVAAVDLQQALLVRDLFGVDHGGAAFLSGVLREDTITHDNVRAGILRTLQCDFARRLGEGFALS